MLPKNIVRAVALTLVLSVGACAQSDTESKAGATAQVETEELTIETAGGPVRVTVEIADTEEERARGLMFRPPLPDNYGMLFHFQQPERASFWMRNTPSSLDIIFIGVDGRILNIAERTTPYSLESVPAVGLTRGVLEIRGGHAAELGLRAGDRVRHRIFPD
ncbi:MAG TPA: DUF192 domain-containing protein [Vitreimonas sp.]|uniref:DUF192 domain-containing protein n=1 Tax=Vitreimonas sp. TaxID=3069702 RepID=UPI002D33C426|nr:DUF192 domain-containing protein [Vitreimonas sp.]HYD85904.1 DUF192 domain-containing protein [Vitreimonas sp.]